MVDEDSDFDKAFRAALRELIDEKKRQIIDDKISKVIKSKPEPEPKEYKEPKPPKEPKPKSKPKPEISTVTEDIILNHNQVDIIAEYANLIELSGLLGYSRQEAIDKIHSTEFSIKTSTPGSVTYADANKNITINREYFNDAFVTGLTSDTKNYKFWFLIYVIAHEWVHIITRTLDGTMKSMSLDEAIVPIIEYEFYTNHGGALSPHMLVLSEENFERVSHKKKGIMRESYPALTYYYFDQLVGFDAIYPRRFIRAMQQYVKAGSTFREKISSMKKYFSFDEG